MILFKQADKLTQYLTSLKKSGQKIGFVPTMGALHQGHLSLIEASKKQNEITVCSIFINPTQFNNADDFKKYPVTIENDIEQLIVAGCNILFQPSGEEIYPPHHTTKNYELGGLETVLEGFYRPGHFQGVCQVVDRLLEIVQPDNLYLGAKDFQQCKVITKLVSLLHKQEKIRINIEPTFRENDGLAMSSRNLRLTSEQRQIAPAIFEALSYIKDHQQQESIQTVERKAASLLADKGFLVDYLQVVDAESLQPANEHTIDKIAVVAAFLGGIRLIDNMRLN